MARAPAQPATRPARRKTAASGTRKVATPAPPPAEPLPPPKRRIALPSLDAGATLLRNIILNIVFVLAAALFIAVMIGQFLYDQVVIEPIAVPKALIEQGMTPEVAASRLWDGLRDAQLQARSSKASVSAIPDSQRIQFALPDVGLSLDSIVRQTRQFLNLRQTRIGGEIVCKTEACTPGEMQLRLRVLKGTNEVIDLPPMEGVNQRGYFTNAAIQVLSVLDPFIAVAAIADAQPVRATALARRLIRQHHSDAKWAHNLLGNVHTNAEDYTLAISDYRAALALDPEFLVARINLARALRQAGALDASQSAYDALSAAFPDNASVVEGLAELLNVRGDVEGALALLQRAAELNPASPHYLARMGQIEEARGRTEEALIWFERSLEIDPSYILAVEPLFVARASSGDLVGTEALMGAAARYQPMDASSQALHAAALSFLGRQAEALEAFDRALAITPDDFDLLYQSAGLLQELDRVPEAVERFTRAIALRPYDPAPRFGRGSAYLITSQNVLARADLERVMELDTSGTQYGNLATGFLDILDGLEAAEVKAEEPRP
ncbi:MAG: tetratricopeptide repeat protein [Devosia sp.]|uniref:tetratricopeptide repeat protein n=1 Tax=Devosia sp. TaxID=1871048 RepID=UPI0033922C72